MHSGVIIVPALKRIENDKHRCFIFRDSVINRAECTSGHLTSVAFALTVRSLFRWAWGSQSFGHVGPLPAAASFTPVRHKTDK